MADTRVFHRIFTASCILVCSLIVSCSQDPSAIIIQDVEVANELRIPPLVDATQSGTVTLSMQHGVTEFFEGVFSSTMGYNQTYLGPTIRVMNNQDIELTTINNTGEVSSIHKHGLHIPGDVDGGPQQRIEAGTSRTDVLQIRQEASTNWYHPHIMGTTAEQVFYGLSGLLIVEDENSRSLGLPETYGVDDIPLIVQDRLFVNGVMTYEEGSNQDGYLGNTILVNGTVGAFKEVPAGWVRCRILNGSNGRFYNFKFEDNRQFEVIATEGGFLNSAIKVSNLEIWPGERYEIMVNFSQAEHVKLIASSSNGNQRQTFEIIEFRPTTNMPASGTLPSNLNSIEYHSLSDVKRTRTFSLDMNGVTGGAMGINGVAMNMNVINETVNQYELEKWVISSQRGEHPFHLHGASFQILSMDSGTVPLHDQGWKDVVKVNERTEILVKFNNKANDDAPYMYHCHILEHEDMGMMGQFTVK